MSIERATGQGPMGIFGGTFDPIHYGHLRTAFELREAVRLAEVCFLPTGNPPHRDQTQASAEQRLALVRAAVADEAGFTVDDRETRRSGLSYSVDTLAELRAEYPQRSICLLLGMDAFLGLPNWHRWREILGLARIAVFARPGWPVPDGRAQFVPMEPIDISASDIRARVARGESIAGLVPEAVQRYIERQRLYGHP